MCRTRRLAVVAAVALAALVGIPSQASAGKRPGGGPTPGGTNSAITLVLLNSTDGKAHYGQTVTFNESTTATTQPWVNVVCRPNGVVVAQGWNGYFVGSLTGRNFVLASPTWTSGDADCTANLTTPQWAVLASTSFHVAA
jgi:hypothetical protein